MTGSRIGKVKVENFRGIRKQQEFDLSADVILAVGPNGSGKSTLAQVAAVVTTKRWISGIKETPTPRQPGSDDGFVIESTERGEEQLGTLSSPDQRRDDLFFFGDETPKGRLPDLIQSLAGGTHSKIQELARALLVAKGRLVSHDESLDRALRSTPRKRLESERSRLAAELQTKWPPPESGFPIPLGLRLRNGNLPPNWEAILSNLVVDARRVGWLEPALAEEPPLESLTHLSDPNRQTSVSHHARLATARRTLEEWPEATWRISSGYDAPVASARGRVLLLREGDHDAAVVHAVAAVEAQILEFDAVVAGMAQGVQWLSDRLATTRTLIADLAEPPREAAIEGAELAAHVHRLCDLETSLEVALGRLEHRRADAQREQHALRTWCETQATLDRLVAALRDLGVVAATRGTTPEPAKSVLERVQADMESALGTEAPSPRVYDLHATRRVLSEWAGVERELAALPPEDHEIARLEASRASTKAALDAVATIADLDRSNRVGGKGRLSGEAALLDAQTMNALAHLVDTILSLMDVDHKPTIGLRPIRKGDSKAGFGAELVPVRIGESDRAVPLLELSAGQQTIVRLALVFALNHAHGRSEALDHTLIVLDDILDDLDIGQIPAVATLIRSVAYANDEETRRQVIVTSHHELVARTLVDLLLPPPGRTLTVFDFDAFDPERGPRFQCLPARPSSEAERENDDRAIFGAILGEGLAQLGLDGRGTLRLQGRGEPTTV